MPTISTNVLRCRKRITQSGLRRLETETLKVVYSEKDTKQFQDEEEFQDIQVVKNPTIQATPRVATMHAYRTMQAFRTLQAVSGVTLAKKWKERVAVEAIKACMQSREKADVSTTLTASEVVTFARENNVNAVTYGFVSAVLSKGKGIITCGKDAAGHYPTLDRQPPEHNQWPQDPMCVFRLWRWSPPWLQTNQAPASPTPIAPPVFKLHDPVQHVDGRIISGADWGTILQCQWQPRVPQYAYEVKFDVDKMWVDQEDLVHATPAPLPHASGTETGSQNNVPAVGAMTHTSCGGTASEDYSDERPDVAPDIG